MSFPSLLFHKLHPPVLGFAFGRIIIGNGLALALAGCGNSAAFDTGCFGKIILTDAARSSESFWLAAAVPVLSVCPIISILTVGLSFNTAAISLIIPKDSYLRVAELVANKIALVENHPSFKILDRKSSSDEASHILDT